MATIGRLELIQKIEELANKQQQLVQQLEQTRVEELSRILQSFREDLEKNQFTLDDAMEALGLTPAVKRRGRKPGAKVAVKRAGGPKPYEKGVKYRDPQDKKTIWIGGTKGRRPPWLRAVIPDTISFDKQVAAYKKLAV